MKLLGAISTAVLALTLGATALAYPQQEQRDQQDDKDKPAQQDQKKAQPEKPAKQEEKAAPKREEKAAPQKAARQQPQHTQQAKPKQQAQKSRHGGAFPPIATRPTLDGNIRFASARATIEIAASNTADIGSDLPAYGPATGSTRRTYMSLISTACITFATRTILE